MSRLRRYLGGEYEDVWRELVQADIGIENSSQWEDALAVAMETVRRGQRENPAEYEPRSRR
ncbi:MAG: hypothetical protein H8E44_08705 [Planctomycetes bacterium]|nr:hypothetical protein [Planctomycetota bacterium]MBL7043288.1 hypothetical protein [Pirellulaceae bacterium]